MSSPSTPTSSTARALPRRRNRTREGILVPPMDNPMAHVDASQRLAALMHQEIQAKNTSEHAAVLRAETFVLPDVAHAAIPQAQSRTRTHARRGVVLALLLGLTLGVGGSIGVVGQRMGWWTQGFGLLTSDVSSTRDDKEGTDLGNDQQNGLGKGRGRGGRAHSKSTVPTFQLSDPSRRDDVIAGVRAGSTLLSYCFRRARVHGELGDGTHTVYLDWMIQPQGSVRSARVVAPKALLGTAFAQCVGETIEDLWHFSPAPAGVSVSGFPLGPIDVY